MISDRDRLLACRTSEEWRWWIEGKMLGKDVSLNGSCFFCDALERTPFSYNPCLECQETTMFVGGRGPQCLHKYPIRSDLYFAGWDRLRRAGIV